MATSESQIRDYANPSAASPSKPTHIDLEAQPPQLATDGAQSPASPTESVQFRRIGRSNTARTYRPDRRGGPWIPGSEPGIDVSAGLQLHNNLLRIHEECDIRVVDFSQEDMKSYHLTNATLGPFLQRPRAPWVDCRWINVNGLSWDVIEILGKDKNLHRLAIEDLMNTRNRTKADWYSDHTYIVLPLQKLIHLKTDSDSESDTEHLADNKARKKRTKGRKGKQKLFPRWPIKYNDKVEKLDSKETASFGSEKLGEIDGHVVPRHSSASNKSPGQIRTLQRYHGGPNEERISFMEKHSALSSRGLGVAVEQISLFLTSDNTVISFFESSAEDVETPLLRRLSTPETILRRCADASMITQVFHIRSVYCRLSNPYRL